MDVDGWRGRIDRIDDDILELIARRAVISGRIGRVKIKSGLPIDDHDRERAILDRLAVINKGPLSDDSIRRIFGLIIREIKDNNQIDKEL